MNINMAKFENGFITELDELEVVVYGSNHMGANGGGLARTAEDKGWTEDGHVSGISKSGKAYAINTMNGADIMSEGFANLFLFAEDNPNTTFFLTPIGQGIAGYHRAEIETCMIRGSLINREQIEYPKNIVKVGW